MKTTVLPAIRSPPSLLARWLQPASTARPSTTTMCCVRSKTCTAWRTPGASATATPVTDCWTASVPSAPANLTATPGNSQVTLSWSASGGAVSYSVYRGTFANGEDPVPISSGTPATGYTDSSVTNGTTYYYKVTAVNLNGES